jgi:glycosyltransferase involved in cell wall biosynthesis
MTSPIHVVEPTLQDHAGHCHSFIESVCRAGREHEFQVWGGRRAVPLFSELPHVTLHRHFRRRIRKLQALFLYRRLLREAGRILVPTAGSADLAVLSFVSRGVIEAGKVSLYFQWIHWSDQKRRRFARIAEKQPCLRIMGQTRTVVDELRAVGFADARVIPYPATFQPVPPPAVSTFDHLVYAGAARRDKGFDKVVDLVAHMAERGNRLPAVIQACGDYYGKIKPAVQGDLARLTRVAYPGLRTIPDALDTAAFLKLFPGSICLQLYDRSEFRDRFSNVTVDAFRCGAPVVATANTWLGRQVERFDAGAAVQDLSAAAVLDAVERIRGDYARFSRNALEAGAKLRDEHDPRHMVEAITS